ncbi:hypothetical protein LTR85_005275 [Meristemomyces frigidus]|nr:hypothetical protein LTR85_005275 [Meristemomyces frigidus]
MATPLQLLQASIDEDDDSHFRFLVGGVSIKYVTITRKLYKTDDMSFEPTLILLLPTFPPGDWNDGRISRNPQDGRPFFERVEKRAMRAVSSPWHPVRIDYSNLELGEKLHPGVYETTCTAFSSTLVVKFARFEWEVDAIDHETTAYQWIEGQNIGPAFHGHVSEHGRIIGFLIAKVSNASHASLHDIAACEMVLSNLHGLGITHGDINRYNFLVHDGRATLIDFDSARNGQDAREIEGEMHSLAQQLGDDSGLGGVTWEDS